MARRYSGVDGVTWQEYGQELEGDLQISMLAFTERVSANRPEGVRTEHDSRLQPLRVAALEDKILQRAVAEVLNAIFERDFVGFSYGFRPGRSQRHASDALAVGSSVGG